MFHKLNTVLITHARPVNFRNKLQIIELKNWFIKNRNYYSRKTDLHITIPDDWRCDSEEQRNQSFLNQEQTNIVELLPDSIKQSLFVLLKDSSFVVARWKKNQENSRNQEARQHRWHKPEIIAHPDFPEQNFLYELHNYENTWQLKEDHYCVSYYPKEFIKYFRKKANVQSNDFSFVKSTTQKTSGKFFKFDIDSRRTSIPAIYKQNFDVSDSKTLASIVKFNSEDFEFNKLSYITFKNVARGSKPVEYNLLTSTDINDDYSFFVYQKTVPGFKIIDGEFKEIRITYYGLGTFCDLDIFSKYTKLRNYLNDFFLNIKNHQAAYFLDSEKYQEILNQLFGQYKKYWKKMPDHFSSLDKKKLQVVHLNEQYNNYSEGINNPSINALGKINEILQNPSYRKYKNYNKIYEDKKTTLKNAERTISNTNTKKLNAEKEIESLKTRIESFLSRIEQEKKYIQTIQAELEEAQEIVKTYPDVLVSIDDKRQRYKENYDKSLHEICSPESFSDNGFKFIENLKKTGIVIDRIAYLKDGELVDSNDDPTLLIKAKTNSIEGNSEITLSEIYFRITKPVIIEVDKGDKGDNCKKVVGGPYCVRLTRQNLDIGLLTSNAIHGFQGNTIFVHPHASQLHLSDGPECTTTSMVRACLGEAAPIVYSAFQNADPKQAIFAAMTWVTSANSSDTWGRNYKYFPKIQDIVFDEDDSQAIYEQMKFEKNLKETKTICENFIDMEVFNENSFEPNELLESAIDGFLQTQETQTEQTQTEEVQVEPEEDPWSDFSQYVPYSR